MTVDWQKQYKNKIVPWNYNFLDKDLKIFFKKQNKNKKIIDLGCGNGSQSYFLEKNSQITLLHGEAIAVGMILESYLSKEIGLLNNDEYQEVKYIISDFFEPVLFTPDAIEKIIELLNYDKKNEFGKVQFVLLDGIGKSVINQIIDKSLIYRAFEDYYQ